MDEDDDDVVEVEVSDFNHSMHYQTKQHAQISYSIIEKLIEFSTSKVFFLND